MKPLPSLKQLEYLTALADAEHFGNAAIACNVTPSTLSAGIRDLENLLDIQVAERTKRSVLMTPTGLKIADCARQLLHDAENIVELASATRQPLSGTLRLGVIPTISPFLLPRVLPGIYQQYPKLRLFLREEKTDDVLHSLRVGDIDAALIALPYDTEGLTSLTLFDDEFQLACPHGSPIAKQKHVSIDDLRNQVLLLLEEGHCLRAHALDVCQFERTDSQNEFAATSLHTLVQMVGSGLGVTLLPGIAIDAKITAGTGISLIPFAEEASRQIGLVWRKSSPRAEELNMLGKALIPGSVA